MKLLMFTKGSKERLGFVLNNNIVDAIEAFKILHGSEPPDWLNSLDSLIAGGQLALHLIKDLENYAKKNISEIKSVMYPLDQVEYLPPVKPEKLLCSALNYKSHAEELGRELPTEPYFFIKPPNVLIGHKRPILIPKFSKQADYEGELAVIIGKKGKNISRKDAMDYIFGYTIFNDVSLRDLRWGKSGKTEYINWFKAKSLDTLGPIGPWIVTRDEILNPHNLRIRTFVNNELRQNGNTAEMIFNIPTLIEYASECVTLKPGDVIATGTPAGVGLATGKFLKHGDVVRVEIESIGELENNVVLES
jgi:2-keto-4-pentenoate hydratase/2-oxohepta-3-ene-1,7-dioic acid hydratase in catechol pathway